MRSFSQITNSSHEDESAVLDPAARGRPCRDGSVHGCWDGRNDGAWRMITGSVSTAETGRHTGGLLRGLAAEVPPTGPKG